MDAKRDRTAATNAAAATKEKKTPASETRRLGRIPAPAAPTPSAGTYTQDLVAAKPALSAALPPVELPVGTYDARLADETCCLTAEISASALRANLSLLRELLSVGTRLCAVVKADCYGHGLATVLSVLAPAVDCMAVATPQEALHLRRLAYRKEVLVFFSASAYAEGQDLRDALTEMIDQEVTVTVVSPDEAALVAECAKAARKAARVHVKLDSGMGRSGVLPEAAPALVSRLRDSHNVRLTGLYTHLATADETDKHYARSQFRRMMGVVESCGGRSGLTLHAANSAATIDLPETHLDMVRPGIAMYGYQPSGDMHNRLPLRPALRLTGRLMQIKTLPAGSRCGYGLTYAFPRDARVGLVPIGYADGYFRSLSNRASMRVRGQDVPIRGRVSMDQTILDLTDLPEAKIGDEVEILSGDPAAPNSVENLAKLAETIPYELTCRLGRRVRRVLVD